MNKKEWANYGEMGFSEFEIKLINQIGEYNFIRMVARVIDYKLKKGQLIRE